jgi:hypothetical protein
MDILILNEFKKMSKNKIMAHCDLYHLVVICKKGLKLPYNN